MSTVTLLVVVALAVVAFGTTPGRGPLARTVVGGAPAPKETALRSSRRTARRATICVVSILGGALFLTAPLATLVVAGAGGGFVLARRRRSDRSHDDAIVGRLAEVIDLYAVALFSGHNVATATRQVASWAPPEFGVWLSWCVDQSRHGRALSDALDELPDRLGAPVRPLIAALVANDRYGAPIATSLALLAADVRNERRRRAEAAARRLPVLLLFPLVICVLPAFLLLTVVPVVVDTVVAFDL